MDHKQFEDFKNVLDDCQLLVSLIENLENISPDIGRYELDEKLKLTNEQCDRVKMVIDNFRRIV